VSRVYLEYAPLVRHSSIAFTGPFDPTFFDRESTREVVYLGSAIAAGNQFYSTRRLRTSAASGQTAVIGQSDGKAAPTNVFAPSNLDDGFAYPFVAGGRLFYQAGFGSNARSRYSRVETWSAPLDATGQVGAGAKVADYPSDVLRPGHGGPQHFAYQSDNSAVQTVEVRNLDGSKPQRFTIPNYADGVIGLSATHLYALCRDPSNTTKRIYRYKL
jgi:hypothetical protein